MVPVVLLTMQTTTRLAYDKVVVAAKPPQAGSGSEFSITRALPKHSGQYLEPSYVCICLHPSLNVPDVSIKRS